MRTVRGGTAHPGGILDPGTTIDPRGAAHPTAARRPARRVAALLLAGAALALTACTGGSDTNGLEDASPAEIGTRSVEALRTAQSVRVVGTVQDPSADGTTNYDLVMSGSSSRGTVTSGSIVTEVVKIADDTYARGSKEYYESIGEGAAAELLADRWVRLSDDAAGQYRYFTIDGFALSIGEYVSALDGDVSTEKINGKPAVEVGSKVGTRLWAANTGDAVPLRLELLGGDEGKMEFSEYGSKVAIAAPANAVDLASLA